MIDNTHKKGQSNLHVHVYAYYQILIFQMRFTALFQTTKYVHFRNLLEMNSIIESHNYTIFPVCLFRNCLISVNIYMGKIQILTMIAQSSLYSYQSILGFIFFSKQKLRNI